uniref:Uncharacterized protein n=1 Tax=Arundo donax TaxID=35708 RepID=A0A0A9DHB9_ARUDO
MVRLTDNTQERILMRSELLGVEIESCWEDEPMDPISMETTTSPSNPDLSSSRPRFRPPQ